MKYQAYPEYKDSEVDWLGVVPEHWVISKFGYVKTVLTDFTANGSFADLKKNVVYRDEPSYARLVRLTDLRVNLENENGVWIDENAYKYLEKSALFGGEFLLANVGAYAGLFYQMPENMGRASLAPNMFMAKFDSKKTLREYMAYVGQSSGANKQLSLNATASSAQPKLNKDDFKSVIFSYPPVKEQRQIANFLDHETAKIDTLIEKQQQLIQLLKEKRQAVISHAVTKGLNPNAPMRDSGVEWLGAVPAHWEVKALKYAVILQRGHDLPSENRVGGEIPIVSSGGFIGYHCEAITSAPTIVTGRYGTIGEFVYVEENCWPLNTSLYAVNMYNNIPKFLWYMLQAYKEHFVLNSLKAAVPGVDRNDIHPIKITIPNIDEQTGITTFLDNESAKLDILINKASSAIELMQERRTALISAAVTGKIDVRNWQAPQAASISKETHQEAAA
jgi:type I restriction enzyme S subunit